MSPETEHHILVIDDEPQILHVVQSVLEDEGFHVSVAASGEEALDHGRKPKLVVLDWMLPGQTGADLAPRLRSQHGDDLPIVVITADGRAAEKAQSIGASGYVRKPFNLDELVNAVRSGLA